MLCSNTFCGSAKPKRSYHPTLHLVLYTYMFFCIVLDRRHICIWEVVSAEWLNHLSPTEKTTRMNNWVQMSLIRAWYQGSFPVCALWNNPHLPDSKHLPPIGAAQVSAEESNNKRTRETFLLEPVEWEVFTQLYHNSQDQPQTRKHTFSLKCGRCVARNWAGFS